MSKKTVLVTGGSGFIGTHLCRALKNANHQVRVLDLRPPVDPSTIDDFVLGNIEDNDTLRRVLKDVSAVYHFAAVVSVPICQQQPLRAYETNFFATCKLLERLREESARKMRAVPLFFSSSAAVYGNSRFGTARKEKQVSPEASSFYGAQKYASEEAIRAYHRTFALPALIFRFFNVYGPGQDPHSPYSGVMSIFASRVAAGAALSLHGGGKQTRDFVSVHDIVSACLLALELSSEQWDASSINLGSGKKTSIYQLAQEVMRVTGHKVPLLLEPRRDGDIQTSLANIDVARKLLNWKPKASLRESIREIVATLPMQSLTKAA